MEQEITQEKADNTQDTFTANIEDAFRKKIEEFYSKSKKMRSSGICPVQDVLASSTDKWSLFIIYNLAYNRVLRFNELKKYINGISSRMLSVSLKKLEASGLVSRTIYAEVPPRVEYSLTEFGFSYSEKLIEVNLWLIDKLRKCSSRH